MTCKNETNAYSLRKACWAADRRCRCPEQHWTAQKMLLHLIDLSLECKDLLLGVISGFRHRASLLRLLLALLCPRARVECKKFCHAGCNKSRCCAIQCVAQSLRLWYSKCGGQANRYF